MPLLERNTMKKGQIDKKLINLDPNLKLDIEIDKKYKVKSIGGSAVYMKKAQGQLLSLSYLITWKNFLEKKIRGNLHWQYYTFKN